jgi:AAA ATPase domain/Adenylate and Guanylate cyclase catalytic domain
MSGIVASHEGSVEKFIGDAVMAVFGVPRVHEDDALRACRAAVEMREAFAGLGIEGRIGVSTGEVVTGTEERLATGDAVNVAARLQQAASPGEVLIAQATLGLVDGAVDVEPVEPLVLKGKAEPVAAFRLVGAHAATERRHEGVFVGRERELALLGEAWKRALAEQRCELVTIVGDAGMGKSRLAAEALASLEARVVRGRCLPYGVGITFWPVVEIVKQLDALPSDPAAAAAIRSLLGESEAGTSAEEIAWAFRKLLEEQAPLVVLFDDIQWAEETFLDLIEHVALLSSFAPLLLLCMARPELLDNRPSWPLTVRLEPLGDEDAARVIGMGIAHGLRARIVSAASGNPLFLSEMLAMTQASEAGDDVVVPASLKALLAARIDQLDPAERRVLERGAVEGEVFHRGAVQALGPAEHQVTPRLAALVRRELIRSERAQFAGEDGFRFRHLLIRDAAYDALPKTVRAELHERFAGWLEERRDGLVELDEVVGYHLEQAAGYRYELGQPDATLADRAGERLAAAGRRALWRGDERAAAGLLGRALELTRPTRLDVVLELDLAEALLRSSPQAAAALADAAAERARALDDETGEALARVGAAYYRVFFAADPAIDELEALVQRALPLLERADDHAGLVHVWGAFTWGVANWRCHYEDYAHASEQALRHARLAGQHRSDLFRLESALANGPRPADEALRTIDANLPENPHPRVLMFRAWLLTMLARFEEAAQLASEPGQRWRELTGDDDVDFMLGSIAATAGDHESAAVHFRRFCDLAETGVMSGFLQTYAPLLGRSLCALGRHEEAEPLAQLGRSLDETGQDIYTQALWRQVQALVHASRGQHAEAEILAKEAVTLTEPTDALNIQADALCDLAEVQHSAGRNDEAAATLDQALERYERKKNLALAARVRDRLAELRAAAPSSGA